MAHYDVFNGDADGLCALQQLRLHQPLDSILVTGVKRDIQLLETLIAQPGDTLTVLDISFDKNRASVQRLIATGVQRLDYFDHHFAGDVPVLSGFYPQINTDAQVCTSLLVNQHLKGQWVAWAVVGAFGDNLTAAAQKTLQQSGLTYTDKAQAELQQLGIYLNYNGYGENLADLHYHPAELFRQLHTYPDPWQFIHESAAFQQLAEGYQADMQQAAAQVPVAVTAGSAIFILPAEAWARRCSGVWANELTQQAPNRAHAVLTRLANGGYLVSVRAPRNNPVGADELCRAFPSGGGRKAAAGINDLPLDRYADFTQQFQQRYG